MKTNISWSAFCTVHWFATGKEIIADSTDPLTANLYQWYLDIVDIYD